MANELFHQFNRRPLDVPWNYDRTELLADGVVHAIGLGLALVAVVFLLDLTLESTQGLKTASVLIYIAGLLAMLGLSAAYNMWPVSPRKWLLRRFDHSAIYLLIAATYTAFIAQINVEMTTVGLLLGIWSVAIVGIVVKLAFPGRLDRVSIGFYLLLGWSGMMAYDGFATLPRLALVLIAAGGMLYLMGVVFHLWEGASLSEGNLARLRGDRRVLSLRRDTRLCSIGSNVGPRLGLCDLPSIPPRPQRAMPRTGTKTCLWSSPQRSGSSTL